MKINATIKPSSLTEEDAVNIKGGINSQSVAIASKMSKTRAAISSLLFVFFFIGNLQFQWTGSREGERLESKRGSILPVSLLGKTVPFSFIS